MNPRAESRRTSAPNKGKASTWLGTVPLVVAIHRHGHRFGSVGGWVDGLVDWWIGEWMNG